MQASRHTVDEMRAAGKLVWLPANERGRAEGYLEGCHYTNNGMFLDAVVWEHGKVSVVGCYSCASKQDAERCMVADLNRSGPLDKDRTIKFTEFFGRPK